MSDASPYRFLNEVCRLKTFTRTEGRIRLSVDDGPPAREFLEDDYDEDNEVLEYEQGGGQARKTNSGDGGPEALGVSSS